MRVIPSRELIGKLRRTRGMHLLPTRQEDDNGDKGHDLADKQDVSFSSFFVTNGTSGSDAELQWA